MGLLAPFFFVVLNRGFNAYFGHQSDVLTGEGAPLGEGIFTMLREHGSERIPIVGGVLWSKALTVPEHSGFLILAFLTIVACVPFLVLRSKLGPSAVALLLFQLGIFVVFLGTGRYLDKHLRTASARVLFQCMPALVLWMGVFCDHLHRRRCS